MQCTWPPIPIAHRTSDRRDAYMNDAVPSDLHDDGSTSEKLPYDSRFRPRLHDVLFTEDEGFGIAPIVYLEADEVRTTLAHRPFILPNH